MGKRRYTFTSGSSHSTPGTHYVQRLGERDSQSPSARDPQFPSGPVHRLVIITSELSILVSASKSSVTNDTESHPRKPEYALANEATHQFEHPILSGQ